MVCSFPILRGALGPVAAALPSSLGQADSEQPGTSLWVGLSEGVAAGPGLGDWPTPQLSPSSTICNFSFIVNQTALW